MMRIRTAVLAAVAGLLLPSAAQAAIVINIAQVGANVVATGSGSFITTGLAPTETENYSIVANGARGAILVGTQTETVRYAVASSTLAFGTTNQFYFPDTSTGNTFGVYGTDSGLHLPVGYLSGAGLSGSATFNNQSLASMGLIQGSYAYTFGSDRVTVNIGPVMAVPEPATWAMMVLGFGAAGLALRRRRTVAPTAALA